MALISASAIKAAINPILKDTGITISVTYKSIAFSYDTETRVNGETITSVSSIRALRSEYTQDEVQKSGGIICQGDLKFIIRADALSSVTPSQKDRINDGSRDWEIIDFKPVNIGSTAIMYLFHCR